MSYAQRIKAHQRLWMPGVGKAVLLDEATAIAAEADAEIARQAAEIAALRKDAESHTWQPIETVPADEVVILANFSQHCLLTGAPHVWTAQYATRFCNLSGDDVQHAPMWLEASFAATNENGEPTHWMRLPNGDAAIDAAIAAQKPATEGQA